MGEDFGSTATKGGKRPDGRSTTGRFGRSQQGMMHVIRSCSPARRCRLAACHQPAPAGNVAAANAHRWRCSVRAWRRRRRCARARRMGPGAQGRDPRGAGRRAGHRRADENRAAGEHAPPSIGKEEARRISPQAVQKDHGAFCRFERSGRARAASPAPRSAATAPWRRPARPSAPSADRRSTLTVDDDEAAQPGTAPPLGDDADDDGGQGGSATARNKEAAGVASVD